MAIPDYHVSTPATGPGLEERHRRAGLDITPSTCVTRWAGERCDYGIAVEGILVAAGKFP